MQIPKEEFNKLFVSLHTEKPTVDLLKKFKQFDYDEFKSYSGKLEINKVLRYINYLYSINSPLVKIYKQDIESRKLEAATLSGFDESKIRVWKVVERDLFELKDAEILKMIMRFLIIQNNRTWSMICSMEQLFYEYQFMIMNPLSGDKEDARYRSADMKKKLREESMKMIDDIDSLYEKLFNENEDVQGKYEKENQVSQHFFSPEVVAKMLEDG